MEIVYIIVGILIVGFYITRKKPSELDEIKSKKHIDVQNALRSNDLVTKTNNEGIVTGQIKSQNRPLNKPAGWVSQNKSNEVEVDNFDTKILVVDDSQTIQVYLKTILKNEEYSSIIKADGQQALDFLLNAKNNLPSLIITDLEMPIMNGVDLITNIKKIQRLTEIPIIIVSSNPENSFHLLEEGMVNGIMKKPFDKENLIGQIRYLVNK